MSFWGGRRRNRPVPDRLEWTAEAAAAGTRLDAFLAGQMEKTRSSVQKLIEEGNVRVNGSPAGKNTRLREGDRVEAVEPPPEVLDVTPQNIPLDIVYEDGDLLVVNKPKGMVVHPAPGNPDGTLVNALLYHCGGSLSGINGVIRPGIVHRIDKDTSGLLIVAKNDRAHQSLAEQIAVHSFTRIYNAVVYGNLKTEEGTISAPLGRHPADRKRMAIDRKNGRRAVTHWTVLGRYPGCTHIQCRLETGRTHQIRVHLASIGHPLLGDTVYGSKKPYPGLAGQCLHARRLKFIHPTTGELVELECPLPDWFEAVLNKLGQ